MLKAVIFDMDGTLVDTEPVYFLAAGDVFEELGFTLTPEEYAQFTGTSLASMWSFLRQKFQITLDLDLLIDETKKGYLKKRYDNHGPDDFPYYRKKELIFPCLWCYDIIFQSDANDIWSQYQSAILED